MQIDLRHVGYTYQVGTPEAHPALVDVNLTIQSGELIAMIGHGGSGKSTLSLILAGLYKPTTGLVETYDLAAGGKDVFPSVGLVFQYPEHQLFAETVYEEVVFGARNFGVPQDYLPLRVRKSLTAVGLDPDEFWDRSPFSLSGGQQRRVCIAGVLAVEPKMIILDEPTAGLDEGGRRWMLDLVRQLHQAGRTILWITHNMQEAAELAQRILVLNKGQLLVDGTPEQVFEREDLLEEAGLELPQAARIVRELRRRGLPLAGRAISVEQAAEEIAAYLSGPPQEQIPRKDESTSPVGEEDLVINLESVLAAAERVEPVPPLFRPTDRKPDQPCVRGGDGDV